MDRYNRRTIAMSVMLTTMTTANITVAVKRWWYAIHKTGTPGFTIVVYNWRQCLRPYLIIPIYSIHRLPICLILNPKSVWCMSVAVSVCVPVSVSTL